jgi:hypothetical protein
VGTGIFDLRFVIGTVNPNRLQIAKLQIAKLQNFEKGGASRSKQISHACPEASDYHGIRPVDSSASSRARLKISWNIPVVSFPFCVFIGEG